MIRHRPVVNNNGFTLIELLVVIAIIGILTGIAIPNILENLPTYKLNNAARQVMTDIQYARGRAATINREYKIQFIFATEKYQVKQGNLSSSSSSWTLEKEVTVLADDGIDVVSLSTSGDAVTVKPTGTMTATTLTLQNSKGESLQITSSIVGRLKKQ